MLKDFVKYIAEKQLFDSTHRLLLTVSGGIDSVVLAKLCHEAGLKFGIAHCNFQLRGQESEADERFVHTLSQEWKVDFYTERFDTKVFAKQNGLSTQMAARQLRYEWFGQIRKIYHYDYILTAHHQDDLLETVLLNLTRGTGLAGLHGILPKNDVLVRPLLFSSRYNIENYAKAKGLEWREDSSNASNDYLRNRLRHDVVPVLQKMNPKVAEVVAILSERISATEVLLAESMALVAQEVIQEKANGVWLCYEKLESLSSPVERLSYWLASYNFSYLQTKIIWQSRHGQPGKQFFSSTHTLITDRNHWIVTPTKPPIPTQWILSSENGKLEYGGGFLTWFSEDVTSGFDIKKNNSNEICLDTDCLCFPLILRKWQIGDWFCPIGMKGKRKKISDYLVDSKVPRSLKNNVYVLESAGKIVWLVGFRIDEYFKITASTKKSVKFFSN